MVVTLGLLGWAIVLWNEGEATTGDVVLACTLSLSVLQRQRDLAVALVDITQHLARLAEGAGNAIWCRTSCATIRKPSHSCAAAPA